MERSPATATAHSTRRRWARTRPRKSRAFAVCQTPSSDARPTDRFALLRFGSDSPIIAARSTPGTTRCAASAKRDKATLRTSGRRDEGERPGGKSHETRRAAPLALLAARGGQLSRTKWLFAVSSLLRRPGDGARVRCSRTRRRRRGHARDSRPCGLSRRAAPPSSAVPPRLPPPLAPTLLFEIFAHTRRTRRRGARKRFRARLLRWRDPRRFLAICLSTDNSDGNDGSLCVDDSTHSAV